MYRHRGQLGRHAPSLPEAVPPIGNGCGLSAGRRPAAAAAAGGTHSSACREGAFQDEGGRPCAVVIEEITPQEPWPFPTFIFCTSPLGAASRTQGDAEPGGEHPLGLCGEVLEGARLAGGRGSRTSTLLFLYAFPGVPLPARVYRKSSALYTSYGKSSVLRSSLFLG